MTLDPGLCCLIGLRREGLRQTMASKPKCKRNDCSFPAVGGIYRLEKYCDERLALPSGSLSIKLSLAP